MAARRAQAALASPGGGDGGRGGRGGGWRSAVPGRRDVATARLAAAAGASGTLDLCRSLSGPRLPPRPRTCCCCGRCAGAPPRVGASLQGVRAPGPRVGGRGKGTARGLEPSNRGFRGPSGRASGGAAPSAPRRLEEGVPAPRASSGLHHRLQQHPSPRAGPKARERRLPGSAAGPMEPPEDTAGPRGGAQDALPGSAPPAAAFGPAFGPAPPPAAAPPPPLVPGLFPVAAVTQRAGNGCGEGLRVRPSKRPTHLRSAPWAPAPVLPAFLLWGWKKE